ncbi:L-histidine N(alpha)-methyltransferase [soil metagenome]
MITGLSAPLRKLPPKYFYDEEGARLFERISRLDAYYPTRTEFGILEMHAQDIADAIGPRARIVEFGSGSGVKTRLLLRHLAVPAEYVPIDISAAQLLDFAASIKRDFPDLRVSPVAADYTQQLRLPPPTAAAGRTVAFFPGSTIGNFEEQEAADFLRRTRALCGDRGGLLLGTDMHKDTNVLQRAYNDTDGVTAAFNLNLLTRINRECGADFDPADFRHLAVYDVAMHRIEMRIVCIRDCVVTLPTDDGDAVRFSFSAGEHIVTEYSHKYTHEGVQRLAAHTGWRVEHLWQDPLHWFSVWLLAPATSIVHGNGVQGVPLGSRIR